MSGTVRNLPMEKIIGDIMNTWLISKLDFNTMTCWNQTTPWRHCTTEQLRIQFRSQPLTNMSLKFPELQVSYWKSDWHWRFNSILNITVISDCKHLHWQTKKSWKNITLQQHCIRRKDATENLETTKDQFTSRLARSRRLHMTIRTTS